MAEPCDETGVIPTDTLLNQAAGVESITTDGQTVVMRSISDQIALDKYLASRRGACAAGGNGWGMVAKSRVVPPSAVGEDSTNADI